MAYWLRILIAIDACLQSFLRFGTHGITLSSRCGTAAAHGHKWGLVGSWMLDRTLGADHCRLAIENDIVRAYAVISELNDPVVVEYFARSTALPEQLK